VKVRIGPFPNPGRLCSHTRLTLSFFISDDDESTSRRDAANAARRGAQAVLDIAFSTEQPARLAPYSGETAVRGESSRRSVNSVDSRTVPQNSSKPVRPGSAKRR